MGWPAHCWNRLHHRKNHVHGRYQQSTAKQGASEEAPGGWAVTGVGKGCWEGPPGSRGV